MAITTALPPKEKLPQTAAAQLETFDVEVQAVARITGKIFRVEAVVTPSTFSVKSITRKAGGEIWPMNPEAALEYSTMLSALAERSTNIYKVLKGIAL